MFILADRSTGDRYVLPAKAADESTIRFVLADRKEESLTVYTDGFRAYEPLDEDDAFGRDYVAHGDGEYADGDVHVNTCESHGPLVLPCSRHIEASPRISLHRIPARFNFVVVSTENQRKKRSKPSSKLRSTSPTIYATRAQFLFNNWDLITSIENTFTALRPISGMHVRLATTEDLESISAVARETWHDTYDELEPETIDWAIDEWYGEGGIPLEAPGTVVLVVEREDGEWEDGHEIGDGEREDGQKVEDGGDGDGGDDDANDRDDGAENDIVGFAQAVVHGDNADVLRLYVHPDYQGQGIGTTLHERLRIQLEAYDVERIQLIDFAFNDEGRGFYESLGFEQTGEGEVEIDGKFYPELVYTLEV